MQRFVAFKCSPDTGWGISHYDQAKYLGHLSAALCTLESKTGDSSKARFAGFLLCNAKRRTWPDLFLSVVTLQAWIVLRSPFCGREGSARWSTEGKVNTRFRSASLSKRLIDESNHSWRIIGVPHILGFPPFRPPPPHSPPLPPTIGFCKSLGQPTPSSSPLNQMIWF